MIRRTFLALAIVGLAAAASRGPFSTAEDTITLATTSSTDNSGLLAHIHPDFEKKTGIRVKVVAKGTGASLQLARDGNADVILVRLIDAVIEAAGSGQLARYDELVAARNAWDGSGLELQGHRALWNHDFVLQRTDQYYVSTKMNSVRSSGNETGNNNNLKHYHMGDGTTLLLFQLRIGSASVRRSAVVPGS